MAFAMMVYPLSDGIFKKFIEFHSVEQTAFLRAATRLLPLLVALFFTKNGEASVSSTKQPLMTKLGSIFVTRKAKKHLIRLAVNLVYTALFMYAYSQGSLTFIYTLSYTSPLFFVLLGAFVLKERVSLIQWGVILCGFLGVILVIQPETLSYNTLVLVVLAGSFLGALNKLLMRSLAATEHVLAITIYPNVVMIIASSLFLFWQQSWTSLPPLSWVLFLLLGVVTALGQYAIAAALRHTKTAILAPIEYSTLLWVVLLDALFWDTRPSGMLLLGSLIIIGSNLYTAYQAQKKEKALPFFGTTSDSKKEDFLSQNTN